MSDDFVAHSRKSWREMQAGGPTDTQIAVGCLQRIADATEKMADRWAETTIVETNADEPIVTNRKRVW